MAVMISFSSNFPPALMEGAVNMINEWINGGMKVPLVTNRPGIIVTILDRDKGVIYVLDSGGNSSVKKAA